MNQYKEVRKCVILTAGKGTRLQPYTYYAPKPLLKLHGKPILEFIIDGIVIHTPIREFLMIIGYKGEMIQKWCNEYYFRKMKAKGIPISFTFIEQKEINGTGGATLLAEHWTGSENFMEVYGDILVYQPIYGELYKKFASQFENSEHLDKFNAKYAFVGNYTTDPSSGAAIYVDGSGMVTEMIEKPPKTAPPTNFNNAGLYIFTPRIFDELKKTGLSPRGEIELTAPIIEQIRNRNPPLFIGMKKEEFWCDVGTKAVFEALDLDETLEKKVTGNTLNN